jgi:hypothetical protein
MHSLREGTPSYSARGWRFLHIPSVRSRGAQAACVGGYADVKKRERERNAVAFLLLTSRCNAVQSNVVRV